MGAERTFGSLRHCVEADLFAMTESRWVLSQMESRESSIWSGAQIQAAECSALAPIPGFGERVRAESSLPPEAKQHPGPDVMPDSRHNAAVLFLLEATARKVAQTT